MRTRSTGKYGKPQSASGPASIARPAPIAAARSGPTLSEEEVNRLAARLGTTPLQFIDTYLEPNGDDDNPWQTRTSPCPFLKDNRCSVYEDRPDNCKGYPYLYDPEFSSRTMGMISRTFTCPIVYEVIEDLKNSWGFSQRRRR